VEKQQRSARKPLHPLIWGCAGCSTIVLAFVILGAIGVRAAIKQIGASDRAKREAGVTCSLRRVPGGVLRSSITDEEWVELQSLQWRDNDRLTYTAMKMPSMGQIMAMSQPGMVVPFWDEEEMEKQGIRMAGMFLDNPVRQYDFAQAADTAIFDAPENMIIDCYHGPAWSPDGNRVVVALSPLDMVMEMAGADVDTTLYLFSPGNAQEWTKLTAGRWPQWSPDGRWITYWRSEEQKKRGLYIIAPDGAGERRICTAHKIWGWEMADGVCTGVYLRIRLEYDTEDSPWEIRYVRLADGESKKIKPHGKLEKLGPLCPGERGFTKRQESDSGEVFTYIGAVELATGRVRWLRKDLPGSWGCTGEILGGRALVLIPWGRRKSQEASTSEDFDPDTECAGPGVFSAIDGEFREIPGLDESHEISPAGNRMAWEIQTEGRIYGMIPAPAEEIAVLDLIYPDELLTGP